MTTTEAKEIVAGELSRRYLQADHSGLSARTGPDGRVFVIVHDWSCTPSANREIPRLERFAFTRGLRIGFKP